MENKICSSSCYSSIPYPCLWQPWNVLVEIFSLIQTCPHFCEFPCSRQNMHVPANFISVPANISLLPAFFYSKEALDLIAYYHSPATTTSNIFRPLINIILPPPLHHQIAPFIKNAKENIIQLQILP